MAAKKTNTPHQLGPRGVGYRIKVLSLLLGRVLQQSLQPYDLTPFHWLVLNCLWREDGLAVSVIGDKLQQVGGTMTGVLDRMEELLGEYFSGAELVMKGLPTVQWLADALHVSPNYLSGMLKVLTGLNAQQHIHARLIEKAKERLSTTALSVSEIAYELGFEHPQSFSKLFKSKTSLSPLEFRHSFD